MWLLLASSHTAGLETYGPLGLAVALLGTFASKAYKREADRADRLEAELREFLPQLLRAVDQLDLPELLRALERLEPKQLPPPPPYSQ